MDLGISGKLALVVGCTGNTGRAVTLELVAAGCRIAGIARNAERLSALGVDLGGAATLVPADITSRLDLIAALDKLRAAAGLPDIVVHVAGGSIGLKDPLQSSADWAKVWQFNLGAAIDINRWCLPAMVERGWGRIVHFSSNGVKLAIGNPAYTSAKAAVEGYVRTMGKEFAVRGVLISAVRPGPIETDGRFLYSQDAEWTRQFQENYVPIGRWGKGEEVAGLVAFLCSQHSSYMAGAIVDIDGGMR